MKTHRNRNFLNVLITLVVVVMIAAVSCKKDDDPAGPASELAITSISPTTGGEGTDVNINGTGFSTVASENTVTVGGKACPVTVSTATLIKIKIPADAATGTINVTVGGVTAVGPTFTFIPAGGVLAIESIEPATGPKNTTVVITGTSFSATPENNIVTVNGKQATVLNASTTKLSIKVPAGAGTGVIKVAVGDKSAESSVFEFVYSTEVHLLAGSATGESGFAEGTGAEAKFSGPYTVAVDADGNVYVADTNNHRIRKITPDGVTSTLAGSGEQGDVDATGTEAQFYYPYGVAVDSDNNVWVADTWNHKIKMITPDGVVTTIAGSSAGFTNDNGTAAQFKYPTGLTVDGDGNVYVADKDNFAVRKITPNGDVSTLAGGSQGKVDANGTDAKFQQPYTVAVDGDGNVYVADTSDHSIRKITPEGDVTTLAGGTQGDALGTGSEAQFYYPYGVAVGPDGNVYVADTFNQQVRMVTADGVVTAYAGVLGASGDDDGAPDAAKFKWLTGVAVGSNGWVYVADKDGNRIKAITID